MNLVHEFTHRVLLNSVASAFAAQIRELVKLGGGGLSEVRRVKLRLLFLHEVSWHYCLWSVEFVEQGFRVRRIVSYHAVVPVGMTHSCVGSV